MPFPPFYMWCRIYYICLIFPFLFKASRLWCSNWYDIWKWVCLMYIYSPFFNPRCFKRTLDLDVGTYAIKKLYSTTKWITWDVKLDVISHFIHICYKEMIKYVIWNRNTISKWDYLYLYYAYIWVIKDVKARRQLRSKTKTLQDIDFYASRKHLCTQAKIKRPLFRVWLILQKY